MCTYIHTYMVVVFDVWLINYATPVIRTSNGVEEYVTQLYSVLCGCLDTK